MEEMLADLFFLEFLSSFFASLYFWNYLRLIFRIFEDGYSNGFAFILIVFLITSSQKLNS